MDYLVQTDKFHKVILRKYSLRKIIPQDQTIRNLLCYYLSLACQKYPKNDIFEYVQNKAYDLRYDVAVSTIGSYSVLKYTLQGVDPKYINDEEYNYRFLEEFFYDCQKPVIINNNFDLKLFKKAKEIYRSNLLYLSENESKKSFNLAIKTYFKGTIRDFDNDGDLSTLKKISCKMLYKYYLSIINDEEVSYAVGDVLNHLSIENKATLTAKYDYFFKDRNKVSPLIIDNAQTKQCYLQIIYDVNIYPNQRQFYAVEIINYIFGGSSNSKLFDIVREKNGLCYNIGSIHFGSSAIMIVSAIIDKKNLDKAILKIDEAFNNLLIDIDLEQIKKYLLLERKGRKDYLIAYLNDDFMMRYFKDNMTPQQDIQIISSITMDDLKLALSKIKKALVYVYGGDKND